MEVGKRAALTRTFVSKTKPGGLPLIQNFFELLHRESPFACLTGHVAHNVVERASWSVQRSPRLQPEAEFDPAALLLRCSVPSLSGLIVELDRDLPRAHPR